MNVLVRKLRENVVPRRLLGWVWHLAGVFLCWWLAFLLRFDFQTGHPLFDVFYPTAWMAAAVFVASIAAFRLYQGLWRFFSFRECFVTAVAFLAGTMVLSGVVFVWRDFSFKDFPRSVLFINYLLILSWEIGGRGMVRLFRDWRIERLTGRRRAGESARVGGIVLVGEPEACDGLIRSLNRQQGELGRIVAIVTAKRHHGGGKLHGIRIYAGIDRLGEVVREKKAETVLILPPFTAPGKVREIIDVVSSEQMSCAFRVVPSIDDITAGRVDVDQIRRVEIEDLLNRDPYELDFERLREFVFGKHIMVTGAGGSIGSEICRQVLRLKPASLTLFEISEFLLFEIEREMAPLAGETVLRAVTGDVKNPQDVRSAIGSSGSVDVIYHAAAYKHVDLMERNPEACMQNNVLGTATLADVAEEMQVAQFVLISTDKAVRPTSLMGASKRLAERVVIERPFRGTRFKAVRFGNVLGSSGSVVPIFKAQIAAGGPVTVTSPEVTRFFMTIPEAVELVLAAGAIGEDRRILVLEMGNPVKIDTLARQMIELSGFVPEVDIPIVYSGLKSGEKEYEELLTDDENVARTDHDRIWVVKKAGNHGRDPLDIEELKSVVEGGELEVMRKYVHERIQGSLLWKRD